MKKVKFNKKLVLNKETISNLNNTDMNNVKGGTDDLTQSQFVCLTLAANCTNKSCEDTKPICIELTIRNCNQN